MTAGAGKEKPKQAAARLVLPVSLLVTIGLAIIVLHRLDVRPRTTDAIVTANTIQVAPEIVGRIATLNVKAHAFSETAKVKITAAGGTVEVL